MKRLPMVLLCSDDDRIAARMSGILHGLADLARVRHTDDVDRRLSLRHAEALWLDLRQPDGLDHLADWRRRHPDLPVLVVGAVRSEPRREAERMGVFAAEEPDAEPDRIRSLTFLALEQRRLADELAVAQGTEGASEPSAFGAAVGPSWGNDGPSLTRALRSVDRPDAVWDNAVDWIASAARVTRVGLFAAGADGRYRLRAGLCCMAETEDLEFDPHDPLVRWIETRLHLVTRTPLNRMPETAERRMLLRALNAMGAELLAPLHARGRLLGWVFTGSRATGIPFEPADYERFVLLVEQVARVIENTLLYEDAVLQKTTAQTLLEAIPTGIISADRAGSISACNAAAERMLDLSARDVCGRPIEAIGGRVGDLLRRALEGEPADAVPWSHPSGRSLDVSSKRLTHQDTCLGAMVLITDLTEQQELQGREERVERSRFWTDLAAGMSHEIRNPLVAIKTFAQLLPERYADAAFREECSTLIASEADRLDAIVEQITAFASPPSPVLRAVTVEPLIRRVLSDCSRDPNLPAVKCDVEIEDPLPPILGDERALAEALTHLLRNAAEALQGRGDGRVEISARHLANRPKPLTEIVVRDNGPGLATDVRERPFSPFATTKARGMGLGLTIVERTARDHGGRVQLDTDDKGTRVALLLPQADPAARE